MARLENYILGEIRGRLNNMVFKKLNGKTIISNRPRKYRIKPAGKPTVKDKFSYSAKLAGKVNRNPFLRCIWDSVNIDGSSPYHKILKINLGLSSCDKLNIKNIITPPGVIVEPGSIRFEMEYITIAYNSKAIESFLGSLNNLSLNSVLFFYGPLIKGKRKHKLIPIITDNIDSSIQGIDVFKIKNGIDIIHQIINFNNCIIYIALVAGKNPGSKEFKWTSTYCEEIEL